MPRWKVPTPAIPLERTARHRILGAARAQFLAHGFHRVTMDDLAQGLGMSKKTIYTHFPSKTALLEAMLLEKFRCVEEDLEAITSACAADFPTGLYRLLACVQRHTEEIRPPFLRDIQREAPDLFQVVQARRRDVIQRSFSHLLGEGRREGLIRKDTPVHLLIDILLGAVDAIINPPRLAELGLSPTSGFTAIISVILEGALTPEARTKLGPFPSLGVEGV
jgi:AcrR family transcriptional regulator